MSTPIGLSGGPTAKEVAALPTDTQLMDAIERYRWDVDAPGEDGSITWVVYDPDHALGNGLGSGRTLRTALMRAYTAVQRRQAGAAPQEGSA